MAAGLLSRAGNRRNRGVGLLIGLLLVLVPGTVVQQPARAETVRPFEKVFGAQTNGAIRITGNTLLTCDTADAGCRAALAGGSADANNNSWTMQLLDADSDSSTQSSSAATMNLPPGAKVLYAGLFWGAARGAGKGGTSSPDDGTTMKLRRPGQSAYETVTASRTDLLNAGSKNDYSSYLDVTDRVRASGNGQYWGADVPTGTGADRYAGWSLVIAYEQANEPLRDLTVFTGYARVTSGEVARTEIAGFLAPPSGAVNARFGSVTYEGDAGVTGDYFAVNGTRLADAESPSANFYGSRITDGGANLTDRNPASLNTLGMDAKVVDAAGILPNSSTSAQLTFASTGDVYYPAALTTQIDLYAPAIHGTKTVRNLAGNEPAKVGDTLEYTMSFANTGDDDALRSMVRDALPANTSYVPGSLSVVSGTAAGGKTDAAGDDQAEYDAGSRAVVFRIGPGANGRVGGRLAKGRESTVRFRVTVDAASAGTTLANTGLLDYTAETLNKPYTYRTDEVLTPVAAQADLALTKTGTPDPVPAGGNLTYTLVARNNGPSPARDVTVKDTLPDGVELVSADPAQGTCPPSTVECALGTVAAGATVTVKIVVRVSSASTATGLTNVATVTTSTSDPNPDNDSASVTTKVTRSADLSLAKSVSPERPAPGESVTYTLTAKNVGPSDAEQVRIADTLPAGLTITSVQPAASCTTAGQDVSCTAARLASGATLVVRVTATLDSGYQGGPLTNAAKVASETPDPDPANNTGKTTVTPSAPTADLVVTKKTVTKPVVAGQPVTYQVTVRNDGPSDARSVQLADDVPASLTAVAAETSAGSCTVNQGAIRCAIGDLTTGSTATVTVNATVDPTATAPITNAATASSSTSDPDPDNNTGRTTDPVTGSADLAITKTAQPVPVQAGRPVTYTLTVTNNGPSAAQSVKVTDPVPAPLRYASAESSQGSCTEADSTVTCAVGRVAPGAVVAVTVVANVPSGTPPDGVDNTATVSSPTSDPEPDNNSATYTLTTDAQANLKLTKTVSPDPVVAGRSITYKLTATNAGPSDAQGVTITDDVPEAVTDVSASATGGAVCTDAGGSVRCTAVTLAAGESIVVTVTGTVSPSAKPGELANTATVESRTPTDPTISDNTSTGTSTVTAQADLALTKVAPETVVAGNELTYRLTVRNAGPSDAVDGFVSDTLPAGTTFVRGTGPAGACTQDPSGSEPVVTCPVGTLAPEDDAEVTVVVKVAPHQPAGKLTNTATVSSRTPDPLDGNNAASAETTVSASADVSITKSVKPSPLVAGAEGLYTLTVRNDGPSTAQGVKIADELPSGVSLLGATSADGTCTVSGSSVSCTLGAVGPDGTAVVVIRVAVAAAQTANVTNTGNVTSTTPDPDPSNNEDTITTEVERMADVEVIKTSDESSAVAGNGVIYRLTVVNHGPSDATAVQLADSLPAGLTITETDAGQGQCTTTGQDVRCALRTIAAGGTTTVKIAAGLDPGFRGTSLANTATAASPVTDPDESNNSSTVTIPVRTEADVSVTKQSDPAGVTPGSTFEYAIVVANAGPATARSVVITDRMPAGLTVVSASAGGTPCPADDGGVVRCALGDLPIGQTIVTVTVRLASGYDGASVTNTATASSSTPDPDPKNNAGTVESPVTALADLAITKAMTPAAPVSGRTVKYTLVVRNNGPSDARDVMVTDELPRGLTKVSTVAPAGVTCVLRPPIGSSSGDAPEAGVVECGRALLAEGATLTVTITATVAPGFSGQLENIARVGAATSDPVIANNEAKATGRTTQAANLGLRKAASASSVVAGHNLTYDLAVRNAGPSSAAGVTVTDNLPDGVRLAGTPRGCTLQERTLSCDVGRIDPGKTVRVKITVTVDATYLGTLLTNTSSVRSTTPDPDQADNTSSVTVRVTPPPPDRPVPPGSDDPLPDTGSQVDLTLLLLALGLVAAGAALVLLTRGHRLR
ncbi:putative repeat protein (TIGR01451 family) [Kribbella amoyensis]|uniref:Putative repeat protein (TIGR01451 family) n=1 Tax=Kribbella amoyensis TaxID=996641 RepID=A0A561BTS2_9ACTN|nr:DUF11 domain-containing protein [Kribbella amoyensis]TWD82228.1 putative repeat protein (TIGR01451 family) [Kribbella amoyensis]